MSVSAPSATSESARPRPEVVGAGPVAVVAPVALSPLPFDGVRLEGGLLGGMQDANSRRAVPGGAEHMAAEGTWDNFDQVAAGRTDVAYHGPCFEDGEAYKWLEALAWDVARTGDAERAGWLTRYTATIAAAQAPDGYLNTYVQAGRRASRYEQLAWDHEIFNNGALIQAGVARYRATGDTDLLAVATRAADHLDTTFGPGKRAGACGHPLTEMALVELYRTTLERRYLELAAYFVEVRGHDLIDPRHGFGDAYHSDRIPVRETEVPEGHAVRAIYLASGATDVAIETGDAELLEALQRQWEHMVEQKMYVTGGLGARWEGEAFGDPYELPADRAYAETCAAIAGMQWSWRLLLATGESRYADLFERQFYNAVLPGIGADGDTYFYANSLQLRAGSVVSDSRMAAAGRQHWFGCSCCPTNIMRTMASVHAYAATGSTTGVEVHQYAAGRITHTVDGGRVGLDVVTDYPWDGAVRVTVAQTPGTTWTLSLRVPAWAAGATAVVAGEPVEVSAGGYLRLERDWAAGDTVRLTLPMAPRLTRGSLRVDSARGCAAIERGPLVYAVEQLDQPAGLAVDDLVLTSDELAEEWDPELWGGTPVVLAAAGDATVRAVPYFRWANREITPMRVWIPLS